MATIAAFIRTRGTGKDACANLRFRLRDGRRKQLFYKSDILLYAGWWDNKKEQVKAKAPYSDEEKIRINTKVLELKNLILQTWVALEGREDIDSSEFSLLIERHLHPERYKDEEKTVYSAFDNYMAEVQPTESYCKSVRLIKSCLHRFEIYTSIETGKEYKITYDNFTDVELRHFASFLQVEHTLFDTKGNPYPKYKVIYKETLKGRKLRKPKARGKNTISKMLKIFRSVWNWCLKHHLTANNPFSLFNMPSQTYGTPYYITLKERDLIANYDLSAFPKLAVQRDIFVFQCLIGCRVCDLYSLTPANVIGGTIQYIAHKTVREKPLTIVVPLNNRAKEILSRYYDGIRTDGKLLPFIKEQKYNMRIKEILRKCRITRSVTIYNSTIGREEIKPICDIASSHMARRTFVGNLYKKVGNIDLVANLSGHSSTSSAFYRYRNIDLETKQRLVEMLE